MPVNLDLSDGLESIDLAIAYDRRRLEIVSINDLYRGSLTGDFDLFSANLDAQAGTLRVALGRIAGPIDSRGSGSVLEITFRIRPDAPPGQAIVNLLADLAPTYTQLNEGGLVLIPAPSDEAGDALDGLITVQPSPEPVPTIESILIHDGAAQRLIAPRITVTFSTVVQFLGNPAGTFRLVGPHGAVRLLAVSSLDESGTRTIVQLTSPGRGIRNGSQADGPYTLTVDGDQIVDAADRAVGGNQDGTAGGDAVETFFRHYGDRDGDDVDTANLDGPWGTSFKKSSDRAFWRFFHRGTVLS